MRRQMPTCRSDVWHAWRSAQYMTTAGSTSTSFPTGVELATTVLRSKDAPTPQEAVYASWYAEAESVLRGLSAEK